jgi:protein TonB
MTHQTQSFGISLLIHLVAVSGVLAAGTYISQTRTVVLDLSLGQFSSMSPNPGSAQVTRPPAPVKREERMITPTEKNEETVPIKKNDEKEMPPATPAVVASVQEGTVSGTADIAGNQETARAGYISAHFARIRDKILKKISYPTVARRMGWSGRVVVAFIICEDGHVEDISIRESSGFSILDQNAIMAVRESCPLPRPPVRTALVMQVLYQLK